MAGNKTLKIDFWTMTVGSVSYLSVVCPVFCLGRIQRPGGYRGHSNRPYFGPGCLITADIPTHTMAEACRLTPPSWNLTHWPKPTQWDPLLHKWDPQNCGEVFQINGCDMELLASQMEPPRIVKPPDEWMVVVWDSLLHKWNPPDVYRFQWHQQYGCQAWC